MKTLFIQTRRKGQHDVTLYSAQYSVLLADIIFLNCNGGKQKQESALEMIQLPALQLQLKIWQGCYFYLYFFEC